MPVRSKRGILFLDFRFEGRRYRQSTLLKDTPPNRQIVEDWDATIRREIHLGVFTPGEHFPGIQLTQDYTRTFTEVGRAYLASHKNEWSEWHYRKSRDHLENRVFPRIGDLLVSDITPMHLRQLRSEFLEIVTRKGTTLSSRSVNRAMQPVKAIFNEQFADGLLPSNPSVRLGNLKERRTAKIEPFNEDEIKLIIEHVNPWYQEYAAFLFHSGWRPEEVHALKWSKVNFVTRVISVDRARVFWKDGDPKTERAIRDVEITDEMLADLKRQKKRTYLRYEYVFVGVRGRPVDVTSFRAKIWEPALKKAGVAYRYPYQARHTFATSSLLAGSSPLWVANQMGTSPQMVYDNYAVYISGKGPSGGGGGHHRGHQQSGR